MREVREERTCWRDLPLSKRHRRWGWDLPAVDIDFVLLEYNKGSPVALIEYKHERAMEVSLGHPSYKALESLADQSQIPFFVCRYKDDFSKWKITPVNYFALQEVPPSGRYLTEKGWVRFLYYLSGRECPPEYLERLEAMEA